ncbi:MAG: MerC domain-containing protein [Cytophagaceae bacterium]|nr:MerC domain-containing protein [Cytophagaceae bacterium]MBK9509809.1 MerC domain-containing protein [Cytophagaceae bacterium]MBK9933313.1 MerC domain-containing protein [Cytophagaceae bacterium]MBL0302971.1 MerC domain-containing protein [Cytophagaceae bacterium]MBL0325801.1 MerC domain-containing protein [Cytophagaceae bacterium]
MKNKNFSESFKGFKSDILGISSASLCVVHCLFTPVLMAILSSFSWWHELSLFFLVISFYSAYETTRHNEFNKFQTIIWLSFILLTTCIIFEEDYNILHEVSYLASFGLIMGHILNIRHCQKCKSN